MLDVIRTYKRNPETPQGANFRAKPERKRNLSESAFLSRYQGSAVLRVIGSPAGCWVYGVLSRFCKHDRFCLHFWRQGMLPVQDKIKDN